MSQIQPPKPSPSADTLSLQDEADRRFVRSLSPDCTPAERVATAEWLNLDAAHAHAYARSRRAWRAAAALRQDTDMAGLRQGAEATARRMRGERRPSPPWLRGALAASLAFAALTWGGLQSGWLDDRLALLRWGPPVPDVTQHLQTAVGEQRNTRLPDGSALVLNTGTNIDAHLDRRQREVVLHQGEALFEVAHDRRRPFVVSVGDDTVTALGTRFQVRHEQDVAAVTLFEGSVRIARADGSERVLVPGERALLAAAGGIDVARIDDGEEAAAWARGWLVFRDEPLSRVVAEVNRYATTAITLADPTLGDLRLSGNFRVGDSGSMASAMAALLSLQVAEGDDGLTLGEARSE